MRVDGLILLSCRVVLCVCVCVISCRQRWCLPPITVSVAQFNSQRSLSPSLFSAVYCVTRRSPAQSQRLTLIPGLLRPSRGFRSSRGQYRGFSHSPSILSFSRRLASLLSAAAAAAAANRATWLYRSFVRSFILSPSDSICPPLILFRVTLIQARALTANT